MSQIIEAIYKDGIFQPLAPVDFPNGIRVQLVIESSDESSVKAELEAADLLAEIELPDDFFIPTALEEARLRQVFAQPTLISDQIIEDRGDY